MTAAVIFACTLLPISGGAIKPYEVRKVRESVVALFNGGSGTPQFELAHYPHQSGVTVRTPRQAEPQRANMVMASAKPEEAKIELADAQEPEGQLTPVIQTLEPGPEMCLDCSTDDEVLWLDETELQELPEAEAPVGVDDLT